MFTAIILSAVFFQLIYLVNSFRIHISETAGEETAGEEPAGEEPAGEKLTILIPIFNCESTIGHCLDGIVANGGDFVAHLIVVLDRCTDNSATIISSYAPQFAELGVEFDVLELPSETPGKSAGIRHGAEICKTTFMLLLDADIVLKPTALAELADHQRSTGEPFSSCLIYPWQPDTAQSSLSDHIICNNRLYRQGVIQMVKNRYRVANFPGGLQLVRCVDYLEVLEDGFLEDLSATYHVLGTNRQIKILPRVLAFEIERQSIRGLFLQRVRWTIGALLHVPVQIGTASRRPTLNEKILVNSYHIMWELQHYVIVGGVLAFVLVDGGSPVWLAPMLLYIAQIIRSAVLGRHEYHNSALGIALHCLVFPTVITAALVGAIGMLIKKKSFFFLTSDLFSRE